MEARDYPILEHDDATPAVIEPSHVLEPIDMPERCVLCFFFEVVAAVRDAEKASQIYELRSEIGPNPIYELQRDGTRVAFLQPGVGAPLSAGFLDELIALGGRKFIACGGAGVLNSEMAMGHLVVPNAAVRDEGASYHYLPPSREVAGDPTAIAAIEATLKARHCEYVVGKTWTTDGVYRETPARVKRRRDEGCLTVEMETAAFFAVARFRGVTFGQILYGGDDVGAAEWNSRDWQDATTVREKLFWLAVEACLRL